MATKCKENKQIKTIKIISEKLIKKYNIIWYLIWFSLLLDANSYK